MALSYAVRIAFTEPRAFDAFVAWLRDAHVAHVCAAGAEDAEMVLLDGDGNERVVEVRYRFASRDAFAAYERGHAPRLREGGLAELARLGATASFTRTTGEVVVWRRA